jgi:hypothetical protein
MAHAHTAKIFFYAITTPFGFALGTFAAAEIVRVAGEAAVVATLLLCTVATARMF